jgi:hypothetical protein
MTEYDHLLPVANKLVKGLAGKPGVHFVDKRMAANWIAQVLNGMIQRNELPAKKQTHG